MIRRLDLRGMPAQESSGYRELVPRAPFDVEAALEAVRPICDDVRHRGLPAVREATARFAQVDVAEVRVPQSALTGALDALAPPVRAGLEESITRLRRSCEAELEHDVTTSYGPAAAVRRRIVPIERVGLYVPGGLAPLLSSVLMN